MSHFTPFNLLICTRSCLFSKQFGYTKMVIKSKKWDNKALGTILLVR